jgi:hypothetical protein
MEKFSSLTEQDVKRITNLVKEQVDVREYEDSDFIEVFVKYFRPWIKKFHGDEVSEYPMSHLVKKYISDFIKDYGIEVADRYYYSLELKRLVEIGKALVVKGTHNLPSLKKEGRFLEKYDKGLKSLIESIGFPPFMEVKFQETNPYNVSIWIEANFDEMLKYNGEVLSNNKYIDSLKNYISSFLGVEYGSTVHGKLNVKTNNPVFVGQEEWVKNVFNKKIKKDIKNLPNAKEMIRTIKLDINDVEFKAKIQLTFRSGSWLEERKIHKGCADILKSMGYSEKRLQLY